VSKCIECRHILTNGRKCHSPALRGKPFCFHHAKLHFRNSATRKPRELTQSQFEDLRGIRTAAAKALEALSSPLVDTRRAGLLLYGLHLAADLCKRASRTEPRNQAEAPGNPSIGSGIRCINTPLKGHDPEQPQILPT